MKRASHLTVLVETPYCFDPVTYMILSLSITVEADKESIDAKIGHQEDKKGKTNV